MRPWAARRAEAPNKNKGALLSQTWVVAIATVPEIYTVPHVEPHNVQGELYPCYSYSCCGRARYDLGGELTLGCGYLRSEHSQLRCPYSSTSALGRPILECLYLVTSRWHLRLCKCRDGCLCMPLVSPVFIVCQSVPAPRRRDHTDANHLLRSCS